MFHHSRIAALTALAVATSAAVPAAAGVVRAAATADTTPVHASRAPHAFKPPLPARQRTPLGGRHHAGPLVSSYTIDDRGAPSKNLTYLSTPTSFNNTGQIFGTGQDKRSQTYNCVAFTGTHWLRVNPISFQGCYPLSMTNANSNGTFEAVGYGDPQDEDSQVAFVATAGPSSVKFKAEAGHVYSELVGVNNNGIGIGNAYYHPVTGFFSNDPPFVLSGKKFSPLQPQCTTDQSFCMNNVETDNATYACPFGGCAINDANVVLGQDYLSGWFYELYTVGQPNSAQNITEISYYSTYPVGLNNANQIAYGLNVSGHYQAWQYQVGQSAPIALGTLPDDTCLDYYPIAQNNLGEVLGYAYNCLNGTVYWTWDPVNGMQDLDAQIPPNSYNYITPTGVNDNGQILVQLEAPSVGTTWGTLDPSGSLRTRGASRAR